MIGDPNMQTRGTDIDKRKTGLFRAFLARGVRDCEIGIESTVP